MYFYFALAGMIHRSKFVGGFNFHLEISQIITWKQQVTHELIWFFFLRRMTEIAFVCKTYSNNLYFIYNFEKSIFQRSCLGLYSDTYWCWSRKQSQLPICHCRNTSLCHDLFILQHQESSNRRVIKIKRVPADHVTSTCRPLWDDLLHVKNRVLI